MLAGDVKSKQLFFCNADSSEQMFCFTYAVGAYLFLMRRSCWRAQTFFVASSTAWPKKKFASEVDCRKTAVRFFGSGRQKVFAARVGKARQKLCRFYDIGCRSSRNLRILLVHLRSPASAGSEVGGGNPKHS